MPSQTEYMATDMTGIDLVSFSDTHAEVIRTNRSGQPEDMWWRLLDPDADISVNIGNTGRTGLLHYPIGLIGRESIGLLQLDDRLLARQSVVDIMLKVVADSSRPDREKKYAGAYLSAARIPTVAIANRASRANKHVKDGKNGEPYYFARTASGLCVFVSHLEALADLEQEDRILELREVPRDNSVYDRHEQFRSSIVTQLLAKLSTDTVLIYEYNSQEERMAAKKAKKHLTIIPTDMPDSIAYVDKFGNLIGRTKHIERIIAMRVGSIATMAVNIGGRSIKFPVVRSEDLSSAPEGQIAIYPSGSKPDGPSTYEIIARVNDDPSHSIDTAIFKILGIYQDTYGSMQGGRFTNLARRVLGVSTNFVVNIQDAPVTLHIAA